MNVVRVAAAALNQTALDWEGNARRLREVLSEARRRDVALVCFPELCLSGYGCEDAFLAPGTTRLAHESLRALLPATAGIACCLGFPWLLPDGLFNCSAFIMDGEVLGVVAKQWLANDGIHYEPRWFRPWRAGEHRRVRLLGREVPFGDLLFCCGDVRVGFEICEDAWVPDRPGNRAARAGADLLLNPSASHFAFGKAGIRRRLVQEASRSLGVGYVYANLLGNEAGRAIYDGDTLIAEDGLVVAEGRRFSFSDWTLIQSDLDFDLGRTRRAWGGRGWGDAQSASPALVSCPSLTGRTSVPQTTAVAGASPSQDEEFARAVSLGLWDYLRKSRSGGAVVSLSGGADSAAVATLVRHGLRLCCEELGYAAARERFAHHPGLASAETEEQFAKSFLLTAYQATANSGEVTRAAAAAVAAALGGRHLELDVEEIADAYRSMISSALGRPLNWEKDDLALQNIQARVRSPSVWLLANLEQKLLLATSNRSEAAVGYATMDGDTSGGLSPIAGIDKAFLRRWLRWVEVVGLPEVGPMSALSFVTAQAPTAELRPAAAVQTDEADLMPYEVLDAAERAAIRDRREPHEVFAILCAQFPAHSEEQLLAWVERFFRLFSVNQWKRERYAPSFHVDDENLDPKTWCRFPILSGGFGVQLAQLRQAWEAGLIADSD